MSDDVYLEDESTDEDLDDVVEPGLDWGQDLWDDHDHEEFPGEYQWFSCETFYAVFFDCGCSMTYCIRHVINNKFKFELN